MNLANVRDDNGDSYIPASQRPDGTWRKARRVKEGYVPQEEVPLYESKGKQFLNRQVKTVDALPAGTVAHCTIPGLFIMEEKEKVKSKQKKKHAKKTDGVTNKMERLKITEPPNPPPNKTKSSPEPTKAEVAVLNEAVDPAKKLKNLKKRLREVETLEEKVKGGEIVKPDPDQLKKIDRKPDLLMQIRELEKKL